MSKHDHDRGLQHDLRQLRRLHDRRGVLRMFAGLSLLPIVGCSSQSIVTAADGGSCSKIPDETAGPFPGDGSNGPNVLTQSGVVRRDIRSSFGASNKVAEGVPLTVDLTLVDTSAGCATLAGYVVYLWHCDRAGLYSMYSQGATGENYLRGVQAADTNGVVTFTTTFPGAYSGRWPHIHFEVYPSLGAATAAGNTVATSQLALPEDICRTVYATSGYEASVTNLAKSSLDSDNVFSDGVSAQLATMSGDLSSGLKASLTIGVST